MEVKKLLEKVTRLNVVLASYCSPDARPCPSSARVVMDKLHANISIEMDHLPPRSPRNGWTRNSAALFLVILGDGIARL